MTSKTFIALLVMVLFFSGCYVPRTQTDEAVRSLDLSRVYRADKELQAALSTNRPIDELEKLTIGLKAEISIVQDQISGDPRVGAKKNAAGPGDSFQRAKLSVGVHTARFRNRREDRSCASIVR